MNRFICVLGFFLLFVSFTVQAGSILRIKCDDEDAGAEVYINGKLVGECPADIPVNAGTAQLRVRKISNHDYEKTFEKELRVFDGVAQRVDVIMSAPRLTSQAKNRQEAGAASAQLSAAESGDIEAMRKVAEYYETGFGLEKSPAKARNWREKAESTIAQAQLKLANDGDVEAMEDISSRYSSGRGVKKDTAKAVAWSKKAEITMRENNALEKQKRLDKAGPFGNVREFFHMWGESIKHDGVIHGGSSGSTLSISLPFSTVIDLISLPTDITNAQKIRNEAALRPSTWGKPDSMIARASRQHQEVYSATESLPVVVAAQ